MTNSPLTLQAPYRVDATFPKLTPPQVERLRAIGEVIDVAAGEILIRAGDLGVPLLLVLEGEVEAVREFDGSDTLLAVHGPGQFTGEVNMISGRRSVGQIRARMAGRAVRVASDRLVELVATDPELGDVLMRAFLLRRVELVRQHVGDVVVIGSTHCAGTLRLQEFLSRNGHPFSMIDLDTDAQSQRVLDHFQVSVADVPVVICRGRTVLRNPTNKALAACLGFNDAIDEKHRRDLVVVGAGPAGLAAAVYAASEGLQVLVLEANAPGGQAGSSSRIENYLGFPTGVSGQELAGRALVQAQKFGAQIAIADSAVTLTCERKPYVVVTADGARIEARTIVIATGAQYRKLAVDRLARFEGSGVYYGATFIERAVCGGEDVVVVGGGNSAGQAAVYLAEKARRVVLMVRAGGLSESMSRYLIRRIETHPSIELRVRTEIVGLDGGTHLEYVRCRDTRSGTIETLPVRHLFVMTGASPVTAWLGGCVALDANGFIRTGPDLTPEDLLDAKWPLTRPPRLLETSLPGVFAVGDVRAGNVKRVASAVGEGSISVAFVHQALRE
jgi:thioredoxin reductase (NADPH)